MVKKIGGTVAGGGAVVALGAWLPWVAVLAVGVVLLLALTVTIVVLTAARGRDERQQRNSAAVLDRLLGAAFRKGLPESGQPGPGAGRPS